MRGAVVGVGGGEGGELLLAENSHIFRRMWH